MFYFYVWDTLLSGNGKGLKDWCFAFFNVHAIAETEFDWPFSLSVADVRLCSNDCGAKLAAFNDKELVDESDVGRFKISFY